MIEHRIEGRSAHKVMHEGVLHAATGRRHGRLVRTAISMTEHGLCHTFEGTERFGQLLVPANTPEGDVLDKVQLNPTAFGQVLPQFARPFSKFLFTKVEFEEIPEISQVNEDAYGSLYFGLNFDPDAELPYGPNGVSSVATWSPNEDVLPLKAEKERRLKARLSESSQIPLFVGLNGDAKFESQAQMVALSGTALNTGGSGSVAVGEWFIHYTINLYQINTTPSDVGSSYCMGHIDGATDGLTDLNATGWQWLGSGDTIVTPPIATGVSFITPTSGTYVIEMVSSASAGNTLTVQPILSFYSVANLPPPLGITGSFLGSSGAAALAAWPRTYQIGAPNTATYIRTINLGTVSGVITAAGGTSRWCFTAPQGTPFLLTTGSTSGGVTDVCVLFAKIDNVYHRDGRITTRSTVETTTSFMDERTQFHTLRNILLGELTDSDKLLMIAKINDMRAKGDADEGMLSVLIEKLKLPVAKCSATTMILPALAAVASWAVATFGPVLAEKALRFIQDKLAPSKKNE